MVRSTVELARTDVKRVDNRLRLAAPDDANRSKIIGDLLLEADRLISDINNLLDPAFAPPPPVLPEANLLRSSARACRKALAAAAAIGMTGAGVVGPQWIMATSINAIAKMGLRGLEEAMSMLDVYLIVGDA